MVSSRIESPGLCKSELPTKAIYPAVCQSPGNEDEKVARTKVGAKAGLKATHE
jgi:hypothetical protein